MSIEIRNMHIANPIAITTKMLDWMDQAEAEEFEILKNMMKEPCTTEVTVKENILQQAIKIVNGPRRSEYGHPKKNFSDIAKMWSVILDHPVTSAQVINCMIALKLCRAKQGWHEDSYKDIGGYALCRQLIEEENE